MSVASLIEMETPDGLRQFHCKSRSPHLASEASMLSLAATVTAHVPGISPVRLVQHLPEKDMLLTEYIPGVQNAFNWMWNQSSWIPYKRQASHLTPEEFGARLGRWLRTFHRATAQDDAGPRVEVIHDLLKRARTKCGYLHQSPKHESIKPLVDAADRLLQRWFATCDTWSLGSYGFRHGDLHLMNLGVTNDGRITIFDFGECCVGGQIEDTVRLCHELNALGATTTRRQRYVARCVRALKEAYEEPSPTAQPELADLITVTASLINLIVLRQEGDHWGWTARLWKTRLFDYHVGHLEQVLARRLSP